MNSPLKLRFRQLKDTVRWVFGRITQIKMKLKMQILSSSLLFSLET